VYPCRLSGVRVLVVEDDADYREGLAAWLEIEGADVSRAASGNSGFDTFVRERPAVIVSDICMPDGDGYALIKRVRALPVARGGLTPAIAMSCIRSNEQSLTAGFQVFVEKPCDPVKLIDLIADLAKSPLALCLVDC
jgi:CheY-like chemotaxis protein